MKENALSSPPSVEDRFEVAKRRSNTLRDVPAEADRPKGWKIKVRPTGGLKPDGFKITGKKEF